VAIATNQTWKEDIYGKEDFFRAAVAVDVQTREGDRPPFFILTFSWKFYTGKTVAL